MFKKKKKKQKLQVREGERSLTSDILAVVDATVDGAEGATGKHGLDDELGGVDLPLQPLLLQSLSGGHDVNIIISNKNTITINCIFLSLLVLLHGPNLVEVPLQLVVQALQINLIRPHKPITALLHLSLSAMLCYSVLLLAAAVARLSLVSLVSTTKCVVVLLWFSISSPIIVHVGAHMELPGHNVCF